MKNFMVVGKDSNGHRIDRVLEDEDIETAVQNFQESFQSSKRTTKFIRIKIAELNDDEDNFHLPAVYEQEDGELKRKR